MSGPVRYAIYHVPQDTEFARFGARWLGWDIAAGEPPADQMPHEEVPGVTRRARRYGFHATLKPPFRLVADATQDQLAEAMVAFAGNQSPVSLNGLQLIALGRFLALVPHGPTDGINRLAFASVRALDRFRRPMDAEEHTRRMKPHLSSEQRAMLERWGYPHVGPAFRFHFTLTDRLAPADLTRVEAQLQHCLCPLPAPYRIGSIALVREDADGMFRLIHNVLLTG